MTSERYIESDEPNDADAALRCCACGYDLRGLSVVGRCPECGLEVAIATADCSLGFADPRWLRKLKVAARLPIFSGVLLALAIAVALLSHASPRAVDLYGLLMLLSTLPLISSAWLAMAPNPAQRLTECFITPRRVARMELVLGTLDLLALGWAGGLLTHRYTTPLIEFMIIGGLVFAPWGISGAVAAWGLTRQYMAIALLAGDAESARKAAFTGKIFLVSWGLAAGSVIAGQAVTPLLVITFAAGILCLIYGLVILFFPVHMIKSIRVAIERAAEMRRKIMFNSATMPGSGFVIAAQHTDDAADTSGSAH